MITARKANKEERSWYFYKGMPPLTPEQLERLDALDKMSDDDIVYDEDAPRLTEEQLKQFKRVYPKREEKVS